VKILIAEDDPIFRRVRETNLRGWGDDVQVTSHGDEAWEIIRFRGPCVIIDKTDNRLIRLSTWLQKTEHLLGRKHKPPKTEPKSKDK
jgi:DNA-binding NtrC family response regulator